MVPMDKAQDERQLRDIFGSPAAFTDDDIAVLRAKHTGIIALTGSQQTYVMARLEVELIDAVRHLNETSTRLINTTNSLTGWILALTAVGVALTGAAVFVGVVQLWFHH
jgi:hypothetical protein